MAEFFFSVPGALACVGIGVLLLAGRRRPGIRAGRDDQLRATMQVGVSIAILAAGLWVILSGRYGADAERWAAGSIGTVVGYWLKP